MHHQDECTPEAPEQKQCRPMSAVEEARIAYEAAERSYGYACKRYTDAASILRHLKGELENAEYNRGVTLSEYQVAIAGR
jgi:hypothetical protein